MGARGIGQGFEYLTVADEGRLRVFLDAKDLIDIVEHGTPFTLEELQSRLKKHNGTLVLGFGNVRELVAPLGTNADCFTIRAWLERLEGGPLSFIAEPYITNEEINSAISAFGTQSSYQTIDPFVKRFDFTMRSTAASLRATYRLADIVSDMWQQSPEVFSADKQYPQLLAQIVAGDRRVPNRVRASQLQENFARVIERHLVISARAAGRPSGSTFGLIRPFPASQAPELATWIYSSPMCCPGLRLSYEVFHTFVANVRDTSKQSDLYDFAEIAVIPYVTAMTVDRRMLDYVRRAGRKLMHQDWSFKYHEHVYADVAKLASEALP